MAPPRKRRRLSQSLPLTSEMALFEPVPPFTHSVSNLEYTVDLYGARTVPECIEEVHLHIQDRSVALKDDEGAVLQRRQTAYPITTVDANGQTIISTITVGLHAGAAISVLPALSTGTSVSPTRSKDGNTNSSDKTPNSNQRSTVTSGGTVSVAAASTNSTQSNKGSGSTVKSVYLVTLTNNKVRTITRSARPYVTTFADGEVSTICDRNGQCQLSADSTKQSPSPATTSDQSSALLVGGGGATQSGAAAASASASSVSQHHSDNDSSPPLATIAGCVVGGAAGLAVLLILALVFLRWYKRRLQQGHHELSLGLSPTPEPEHHSSAGQSDMAERAGLTPLVSTVPGLFQHQNKSLEEPGSGQRGFAKVSGRKLPSAFSEGGAQRGMNSPPPDMPLTAAEKDLHSGSFYRDSTGFYGGDGAHYEPSVSPEPSQNSDGAPAAMTLSAGPERRPTIHEPGPYVMEPSMSSPNTPVRHGRDPSGATLSPENFERSGTPILGRSETPTLGRSDTPSTIADNRSSRFTEDF